METMGCKTAQLLLPTLKDNKLFGAMDFLLYF